MRPETRKIADLVADPANARKHSERNIAAIKASLARFGQQKPIVVDGNGVVRAGNGTLAAAAALGWETIEVVVTDLRGSEATAYAIADNRTAELAEWDIPALDEQLKALAEEGIDLDSVGFTPSDLDQMFPRFVEITEDEVPEPPTEPVTKPGDLWILGDHRLLCGDSSNPDDVDRLLDGQPIHLVNTDPPYNVKVKPRSNNAIAAGNSLFKASDKAKGTHTQTRAKDRPLANDSVSDEEFDRLLMAWFRNIERALEPGRAFYVWSGLANIASYNYPQALEAAGLKFSQHIIWHKMHPVLTRMDFMADHERCFYGWRQGAAHRFFGPNNATDVWSIKKVNPQSMVHLTEKPVELAARAIEYSSRPGENVLDLFGGSGSTLIAAEQTGRKAFLMEIDPLYCDVIVQRWEKFAGRKAVRADNNPTNPTD